MPRGIDGRSDLARGGRRLGLLTILYSIHDGYGTVTSGSNRTDDQIFQAYFLASCIEDILFIDRTQPELESKIRAVRPSCDGSCLFHIPN